MIEEGLEAFLERDQKERAFQFWKEVLGKFFCYQSEMESKQNTSGLPVPTIRPSNIGNLWITPGAGRLSTSPVSSSSREGLSATGQLKYPLPKPSRVVKERPKPIETSVLYCDEPFYYLFRFLHLIYEK